MTQRNAITHNSVNVEANNRKEINSIIKRHLEARGITNEEAIRITGHSTNDTQTYSKIGLVIKA